MYFRRGSCSRTLEAECELQVRKFSMLTRLDNWCDAKSKVTHKAREILKSSLEEEVAFDDCAKSSVR